MRACLPEGLLRSYLDGEVSAAEGRAVKAHLAGCRACAATATALDSEMAAVSDAFSALLSTPVPAERLRQSLRAALDKPGLRSRPAWGRLRPGPLALLVSLDSPLLPSRRFAFSAACAVFGLSVSAVLITLLVGRPPGGAAGGGLTSTDVRQAADGVGPSATDGDTPPHDAARLAGAGGGAGRRALAARPDRRHAAPSRHSRGQVTATTPHGGPPEPAETAGGLRAREREYVRSIGLLTESLGGGGAGTLKPSLRVEYERNLAVFDVAIAATRRAALRNPRDANARQFLWSAYRGKLEFLNRLAARKLQLPLAEE